MLQLLRSRPVILFGVVSCAFVVWIWRESLDNGMPPKIDAPPGFVPNKRFPVSEAERAKLTPHGTAQTLQKLKPGMTRTEVEGLVGAPAPNDIHPATVVDGRVVYYTAYEADLDPVATIRPLGTGRSGSGNKGARPARTLVTLEFDATKPGHPLVEVHYPDPLF